MGFLHTVWPYLGKHEYESPLQKYFYPIVNFFTQIAALDKKAVDIAADESSKGPLKKKEIEIVTKATIEKYHSQYVDICRWSPKNEMFVTASTDKKAFWWHCKVRRKKLGKVYSVESKKI